MRQTDTMSVGAALRGWFRRTGSEILGWVVVVVGVILMPLPGPGMVIVVSGLAILSRHYVWAQRVLGPLERKATEAAKFGVETWPRITVSFLGGLWLAVLGVIWWIGPDIPEFEVLGIGFGPELPAQGWATALGLWASAVAAWVLLAYSVVRWREPRPADVP
jgi:uncharacterized protein (TIGR02611 family)